MNIDFKNFEIYKDLTHKSIIKLDVRETFANMIYQNGVGVAAHALALKIYESNGMCDYNDKEILIMRTVMEHRCTPVFIDSFNSLISVCNVSS